MAETQPAQDREREIFLEALEASTEAERASFLARACGADAELRERIDELLKHHKQDAFLETPAVEAPRLGQRRRGDQPGTALQGSFIKIGDRIGRYKLLQEIGEGACGTVYMAEQEEPVRRRVALKIIKLGMDSKSVIARFEAERQALALMDHPNIAKVFDAGATDTGRPYFVMELVRGIRITEYCDENQLTTCERLDLFSKVCHAIQHAHQKGIIHRDIKPSNILVTLHDGVPVPKVIDFGIAKAVEQRLTDKTVFTQFQAFIGTPAYTSPEQAEMSGLDIDTRSDIYSLGVLLYELLTGQTPFDPQQLMESGLDEMRRIIRQDEPLRPSTRVGTFGMAEATTLARTRHSGIAALVETLQGDLDWIVMKCLEKDRTRRYPTANALALDIQRYLENEPVLARPPSTRYRLQKFIRRNRVVVAAASAVTVILIAAVVVSSWLAVRARIAEHDQAMSRQAAEKARRNESVQRQRAESERTAALRRSYTSDMNLVQQALAANNCGRVNDLLDRHRPKPGTAARVEGSVSQQDFRQWEWRYFWSQSRSEAMFSLPAQSISVDAVALSPNGRLLVTGDRFGKITLWDVSSRSEVAVIQQSLGFPGFSAPSFAFSPDGSKLAWVMREGSRQPPGGRRATVMIATVATRQVTTQLPQTAEVDALAFTRDDQGLLILTRDDFISAWDLASNQRLSHVKGPGSLGRWRSVFSPDVKWLAIRQSGRIQVVDVETGSPRAIIEGFEGEVSSLAFSPDGETLAAGPFLTGASADIRLFSTSSGADLGELKGHGAWVPGLAFTPDGQRLISTGGDQMVRIWDVQSRRELAALRGHRSEVNCVAVNAKLAVTGCKDGSIFGWDLEQVEHRDAFAALAKPLNSIEFFPDSRTFLSANPDGSVSLWDATTLRETEQVPELTNVGRLLISPDGLRVYAGTDSGAIQVLDWSTRLIVTNLATATAGAFRAGPGGRGPFRHHHGPLGLVNGGRTLIVEALGQSFRLIDTTTWQTIGQWQETQPLFPPFSPAPLVSPLGDSLAWAGNGVVELRKASTGESQATLTAQTLGISGLAFSPDGTMLAASSIDGTVNLWNAHQGQLLEVLRGHLLGVHAVSFSPDGQRLATVSLGAEAVKLWDVPTRHEVATLAAPGRWFFAAKFSPDGKTLVAIDRWNGACVWHAPSCDEIALLEGSVPNELKPKPPATPAQDGAGRR
ncbi:MAG: protein kinase [Verrucomicrobiota bacterium]